MQVEKKKQNKKTPPKDHCKAARNASAKRTKKRCRMQDTIIMLETARCRDWKGGRCATEMDEIQYVLKKNICLSFDGSMKLNSTRRSSKVIKDQSGTLNH